MNQEMQKNQVRMEKQAAIGNPVNNHFYRSPVDWASCVDNVKRTVNPSESFTSSGVCHMESNPVNNFVSGPVSWAPPINVSNVLNSGVPSNMEVYNPFSIDTRKVTVNQPETFLSGATRTGNTGNNTTENRASISWTSNIDNRKVVIKESDTFTTGALHNLPADATPVEYFKLFFTSEMCHGIFLSTNESFSKRMNSKKANNNREKPLESEEEILNFICILLIMGICHLPEVHSYWSENPILGNKMVKSLMSRDRFFAIMRHFCLSHSEAEEKGQSEKGASLCELRPFITDFKLNFMKYFSPFKELGVCENNITYSSKSFLEKPAAPERNVKKKGIKVWMLLDFKTGYVYNFEPYSGRKLSMDGKGLENDLVLQLCSNLRNPGHYIFLNRYLTSVPLLLNLLDMGHYSIGFICKTKPNLPEGVRGDDSELCKLYQCVEVPNLTCILFRHNGEKVVVSTGHVHAMDSVKELKAAGVYPCPKTVKICNNLLKKYNDSGRSREIYVNRRFNKYWLSAFLFLLKTSMSNANILYNLARPGGKPMSLLDFSLNVITSLKTFTTLGTGEAVSTSGFALCIKKELTLKRLKKDSRDKHKVVKINGRKRTCRHCVNLKVLTASNRPVESSWQCSVCEVCLCKKCFHPYHQLLFNGDVKS